MPATPLWLLLLAEPAAALRECWRGFTFNYQWCCSYPPGTALYNTMCWNDDESPSGVASPFSFARCCDLRFGDDLRALPAFWARRLKLRFPNGLEIDLEQSPARNNSRIGEVVASKRMWTVLHGVLWDDRASRALLGTKMLESLATLQGRRLRLLDIASGLGLNVVAAAKSGWVDLAVGIEADAEGVLQAARNIRRNGVRGKAHVLHFDVCHSPQSLELLLRAQLPKHEERLRFDVLTMSAFQAPAPVIERCAYELLYALGAPAAVYLDSDGYFYSKGLYEHGGRHPPFLEFAARRNFTAQSRGVVDVRRMHGTDEELFHSIMPVEILVFNGRDFQPK